MKTNDRRVHGFTPTGDEIVRYDRAGKWYFEAPNDTRRPRRAVTIAEAVDAAHFGTARLGLPGGGVFDTRVRKLRGES